MIRCVTPAVVRSMSTLQAMLERDPSLVWFQDGDRRFNGAELRPGESLQCEINHTLAFFNPGTIVVRRKADGSFDVRSAHRT